MSNRKMLSKPQFSVDLEGTLEYAIFELQKLVLTYGPKAKLELWTEPYSDSDRQNLYLMVEEPETNEEMATRLHSEWQSKQAAEIRERSEFERLSAKFGKK